jgi:hypothetical protein
MAIDVFDQLQMLGELLDDVALPVTIDELTLSNITTDRSTKVADVVELSPARRDSRRTPRSLRAMVGVAAAAAVVAGVVAIVRRDTGSTSPVSSAAATAPTGTIQTNSTMLDPTETTPLTTATAVTPTTEVSTSSAASRGPLEVVNGVFLGISQGSLLVDAARALNLTPVLNPQTNGYGCMGNGDVWVLASGGLNLYFEGSSAETAVLTNWSYTGGPLLGFTEMVDAKGIGVGDTRQELLAAYPSAADYGTQIFPPDGSNMRFDLVGDTIDWFGVIDCVTEQVPEEPVVGGGYFLGIGPGTPLVDAAKILNLTPVLNPQPIVGAACLGGGDFWVLSSGGLTLYFEGPVGSSSAGTAILTNWNYTGGPVREFTELTTDKGINIGGTRQDILDLYPSASDLGDEIPCDRHAIWIER